MKSSTINNIAIHLSSKADSNMLQNNNNNIKVKEIIITIVVNIISEATWSINIHIV